MKPDPEQPDAKDGTLHPEVKAGNDRDAVPDEQARHQQSCERQQKGFAVHSAAPFRIWAMWMNLIGTPMRSAQPCWCIRQELSAETMYSAPARA